MAFIKPWNLPTFFPSVANSEDLKECLSNPHVRDILKSLVQSQTPELSIKDAMKEPIFLELAHACLKVVDPEKYQRELGKMCWKYNSNDESFESCVEIIGKLEGGRSSD